jgi:hypothetical protein
MALAAQAYAKTELLWYFRHVGDKLPPCPTTPAASKLTGQLLGQQPKQPQLAEDGQVLSLVAAAAAMYDLMVRDTTAHVRCMLLALPCYSAVVAAAFD